MDNLPGNNMGENNNNYYTCFGLVLLDQYIPYVRLSPDRMGPLGKPPANLALLPSRSSCTRSYPALFELQRQYEAIWVWSYTTFIVIEEMVNRKLAVET